MDGALGQAVWGGGNKVDAASSRTTPAADAGDRELEPDPRAPVLFPPRRSFSSKTAFFSACKTTLLAEYGYTTHMLSNNQTTAVANCAGRRHERCKMQIAAYLGHDGRWVVDSPRCDWAHSHARDDDEVRAQADAREREVDEGPASERGAARGRRASAPAEGSDEEGSQDGDETDGGVELVSDESSGDEYGTSRSQVAGRKVQRSGKDEGGQEKKKSSGSRSRTITQRPMPGLPAVGDKFTSSAAFEAACVRAVVRIYGYSVGKYGYGDAYVRFRCNYHQTKPDRCNFELVARKEPASGLWVVRSTPVPRIHSHGRHPELIKDSTWLPTVVSEVARAALGLPPGKRARDKLEVERSRGKKRKRVELEQEDDDRDDHLQLLPPPHRSFDPRRSLLQSSSTSNSPAPSSYPPLRPLAASSPYAFTAAAPDPVLPLTAAVRSTPTPLSPFLPAPESSACGSHSSRPTAPFLADLATFLLRLDPGLEHLAPTLLAAGISTEADLALLRAVTPSMRALMYSDARRRGLSMSGEEEKRLERALASV
ncbi:hypothetical protein JCM9279_007489 [Rhodotorula babjevae]